MRARSPCASPKMSTQFHPLSPQSSPCFPWQDTFPFFLKSDNMKQNVASFCRSRFSIVSRIPEPARGASALNVGIKSRPRVFGEKRQFTNALHGKNLARGNANKTLTKRQKTSSADRFCHFVRNHALTIWSKDPLVPSPQPPAFPHARSNRSRFITLVHAATKSFTNFACESELP